CGDYACNNGETSSTCAGDCPSGSTSGSTSGTSTGYCGDKVCNNGETSSTCVSDCSATTTTTGTTGTTTGTTTTTTTDSSTGTTTTTTVVDTTAKDDLSISSVAATVGGSVMTGKVCAGADNQNSLSYIDYQFQFFGNGSSINKGGTYSQTLTKGNCFDATGDVSSLKDGKYDVNFKVDQYNYIKETIESNNESKTSICVGSKKIVDCGTTSTTTQGNTGTTTGTTSSAYCGDKVCSYGETSSTCASDCTTGGTPTGTTTGYCGDKMCNNGETSSTCGMDCGGTTSTNTTTTTGYCGDKMCNNGETSSTCGMDCGGTTNTQGTQPAGTPQPYNGQGQSYSGEYDPNAGYYGAPPEGGYDAYYQEQYAYEDYEEYEYQDEYYTNTIPSEDLERQKSDMERQLEMYQNDKEWERFSKQIDRMIEHFADNLERREKEKERAERDGIDTAFLEASIEQITNSKGLIEARVSEIDTLKELQSDDVDSLLSKIDSLNEQSSWGDVENVWNQIRILDTYNLLRQGMQVRIDVVQMMEGAWDMESEIGRIRQEYTEAGLETPADVEDILGGLEADLDEVLSLIDDADTLYEEVNQEVKDIRAISDPEELKVALEDMWSLQEDLNYGREDIQYSMQDFWDSEPWRELDWIRENAHQMGQVGGMVEEIGFMKEEIGGAQDFVSIVKGLNIKKSNVSKSLGELDKLVTKGLEVLTKMEGFINAGGMSKDPRKMEELWQMLDRIGPAAEKHMDVVISYLEDNQELVDTLSEDDKSLVEQFMEEGFGPEEEFGDDEKLSTFETAYADMAYGGEVDMEALVAQIRADVLEEVTRRVTKEVMAQVAQYLDDDLAGKILTNVMNNLNVFGDKGNKFLENAGEVLEVVEQVDFEEQGEALVEENPELEDEMTTLEDLQEETKTEVITSAVSDDLKETWDEVRVMMEAGGTEEEFQESIETLEKLFEDNEHELIFGEEAIEFADVPFDGESEEQAWFYDDVIGMREEGIVSGYKDASGEMTGEFGPSNPVTVAEALKMTLESSGLGEASGDAQDPGAQGQWFEGYVKQAEDLGLQINDSIEDWNAPCQREDVAVMIGEVFELGGEDTDYEGVFPDVEPTDPYGGYFQAVYDNDIMTGDGDTQNFRPEEGINRAEISKVMNKALEVYEYNTVNDDLDDLDLEYTAEEPSEEEPSSEEVKDSGDGEDFMEYDASKEQASFFSWLMAFLPFLR
ncbi:MAG: Tenascin-X, partial [uncultured bacterium]